jgi:quercetin dioxygenase-like cupin family protein
MEGHTYLRTHDLQAEHLLLDLGQVVTELHGRGSPGQSRGGVTLVKEGGMSIVLVHLHAGAALQPHTASGPHAVQVLDGLVRVQLGDKTLEVPSGRLIAFDAGAHKAIEAVEDSTLLLTLVSPAT